MQFKSNAFLDLFRKANFAKLLMVGGIRGFITTTNILVFALIGHLYSIESVGYFASYLAFSTLAGTFVASGFPQMLMRRTALLPPLSSRRLKILRAPYWIGVLCSGFASSIFILIAITIYNEKTESDIPLIICISPFSYALTSLVTEELRGLGKAELSLIANSTSTVIAPLIYVLLHYWLHGDNLISGLVATHVISCFSLSLLYLKINNWMSINYTFIKNTFRSLPPHEIMSITLMHFLSAGQSQLAILISGVFGSPALAGIIAVGVRLSGLSATFTGIINASYVKQVARAQRDNRTLRRLMASSSIVAILGVSSLMAPVIMLPNTFLELFGVTEAPLGSALAIQILALSRLFRAAPGISDLFLMVTGNAKLEVVASLCGMATLLLTIALLPQTPLFVALALTASSLIHGLLSGGLCLHVLRN